MNEDVECLDPLRCHLCTFECFSQNELKTHMRIHSRFKLLMCTICNEKFSQKTNLEKHCSFFHGGHGHCHGQTSHIDTKCGQSDETGVQSQTGSIICGTKTENLHSNTHVTVRKRGRPRKTEEKNISLKLDNSTEDVICLSHEVTSGNVNQKNFVQSDEGGEKSGMNKEDAHSDTTSRKLGRPGKNENKTIHSKLDKSSEKVICLSDNATTANIKGGQTNSLQCYICFKQFLWFDDLQVHLNIHTKQKPYVCPVCKCGFREWNDLKTHSLIHTAKDKEVPEDEKTEQLQSDINLKEKTPSISESIVLPLQLIEKFADDTPESSVCKYCKTGFVDAKFLDSHSNAHLSEKPWACNHCQESFNEKASLELHHRNSHAGEKHWICDMCKKRFKFTGALNHHLLIHAGKKPFKCGICDKEFTQRPNLKVHTMAHYGEKPVKCNICSQGFSAKRHLEAHMIAKSHNGETRFKCTMCSLGFNHKKKFQLHMKSHIGEKLKKLLLQRRAASVDEASTSTRHETPKPLESEGDCGKNIANNSERVLPLSRKNKKWKSLTCNYCKTGFVKTSTLELHAKTHTSMANPWLCNNCQESFSKQDALKSHLNFHGEEKHWICLVCKKRFKRPSELGRHMSFHTEERAYECNICKMGFKQKTSLRVHQSRVHAEEKPYVCGFCHHQFKYEEEYKIHVEKCLPKSHENSESSFAEEANVKSEEVHLNELIDENNAREISVLEFSIYGLESVVLPLELREESANNTTSKSSVCNYCRTGFADSKSLESHSKEHLSEKPWTCNHCQESFHEELLRRLHHRNSHAGENHCICHICKKRFKFIADLSRHLLIHTGKKPFKCNTCDKCFTQKANLQVHRMTHTRKKRFKCNVCSRGFKHKQRLHLHMNSHNGEKQTKLLFQRRAGSGDESNTSRSFVCGFCHQRFKYRKQFKRHVQKCLPKTHESSESFFGDEENVKNEEAWLNEISDEKSACEIQVSKIVHFSNDGSENLGSKLSADIYTQKSCCSSSLSSPAFPRTKNGQRQFGQIELEEKSNEPEELKQSTDIDKTTCSKLSEENRSQEWTSFLKVFNVKVARKF